MARLPQKPEFQAPDEITSVYPIGALKSSDEELATAAANLGFSPVPAKPASSPTGKKARTPKPSREGGIQVLYLLAALGAGGLLAAVLGLLVALAVLM